MARKTPVPSVLSPSRKITLPLGEPELMRVSAFERYLEELRRESGDESLTRLSSLNPSLLQDLLRAHDRRLTMEEIQKRVAEHFKIRISDMSSARRSRRESSA